MPPAGAARTAATFDSKSCTKLPHAAFTNNLYASTLRRVNSLYVIPHLLRDLNTFTAQTIHAYEVCFGYSYCSLRYRGLFLRNIPRRDYRRGLSVSYSAYTLCKSIDTKDTFYKVSKSVRANFSNPVHYQMQK